MPTAAPPGSPIAGACCASKGTRDASNVFPSAGGGAATSPAPPPSDRPSWTAGGTSWWSPRTARGLASTLPGIDEAWIYLAVQEGDAIVLCDEPLATEVHKQRITQLIALESWRGNLVMLTGQTLLCADPRGGLAAASSRFHTDFAACREDGIVALAGPYDQLHLVAAPALAAEANRRIAWTRAP